MAVAMLRWSFVLASAVLVWSQLLRVVAGAVFLVAFSGVADAKCRVVTDCSKWPCQQLQECDSSLDPPAEVPPGVGPVLPRGSRPPHTPGTAPPGVPTQRLGPPAGTSSCRPMYICWKARCDWQTVCN